jgi:hypothetical protein
MVKMIEKARGAQRASVTRADERNDIRIRLGPIIEQRNQPAGV